MPIIDDLAAFTPEMRQTLALEAMREALISGDGPACLCAQGLRDGCELKNDMALLARLAVADTGFDEWFKKHWRYPECG